MCSHHHHCEHSHKHEHHHHHDHSHGWGANLLGQHTELYFALLTGFFLLLGFISTFSKSLANYHFYCYLLSFFFGSFFVLQESFQKILKRKFEVDFLMFVAACGAAYIDKWAEGALLLFLFSLGHSLEHFALGKAEKAISGLGKLTPQSALVKKGTEYVETPISELKIGDEILVKTHSQIAADGVVIAGQSSVNQAPITGESVPVDKAPIENYTNEKFEDLDTKHNVFAGTLNGASPLEIRVLRLAKHSTIARMVNMVKEAQAEQSPTQRLTDKIEKYYVPSVLLLVVALCFVFLLGFETFPNSLYRAITVLVASSPCALAISTPGTVLSGIARGAQKGVLFKGGGALENLGSVSVIAFDKTGTLTEGKPKVMEVITNNITTEELCALAMSIERFSTHPLAQSIVDYEKGTTAKSLEIAKEKIRVVEGKGMVALHQDKEIRIGKLAFLKVELPQEITSKIEQLQQKGYTLVGVSSERNLLGVFALLDSPKQDVVSMLQHLQNLGVAKLAMLTGDQKVVAKTVAEKLQINEVLSELLPEEKVAAIKDLQIRYGKTAMVGDGVNDAPAMAASTVSIAMGAAGSDVALETADIALLSDNMQQIPFAVGLSRKAKQIIKQNLFISLGSITLLVPIAILGITGIGATVFLHEGTTILVILNALRLLSYRLKV